MSDLKDGFFSLAKYGEIGVIIALIATIIVINYLYYQQNNNHIEHWTEQSSSLNQTLKEANAIDREFIEVLTELRTVIRNK